MSSTVLYMSMSLDGFIAGPNESPENGLGDGGERLHDWPFAGEPGVNRTDLRRVPVHRSRAWPVCGRPNRQRVGRRPPRRRPDLDPQPPRSSRLGSRLAARALRRATSSPPSATPRRQPATATSWSTAPASPSAPCTWGCSTSVRDPPDSGAPRRRPSALSSASTVHQAAQLGAACPNSPVVLVRPGSPASPGACLARSPVAAPRAPTRHRSNPRDASASRVVALDVLSRRRSASEWKVKESHSTIRLTPLVVRGRRRP